MSQTFRRTHSQFAKSDTSTHSTGGLPDEGVGHRQARLEHILLEMLQSLINDEATDPSLDGVEILAVQLSADGGHARVAYAVAALLSRELEVGRASKAALVRATGFLRARLAEQLHLRKLPKLTFTFVGVAQVDHTATGGDEPGGQSCPE